MQLARMMGILIVFGVPGIILGGLFFHLFHNWAVVAIFEALLVCGAATTSWKAAGPSK